jgi:hypothetical protein
MKLAMVGTMFGVAAALALSRVIRSMLFEVTPFDLVSYVATVVVLLAIAALACYVPARRAMRVDPVIAGRPDDSVRGSWQRPNRPHHLQRRYYGAARAEAMTTPATKRNNGAGSFIPPAMRPPAPSPMRTRRARRTRRGR